MNYKVKKYHTNNEELRKQRLEKLYYQRTGIKPDLETHARYTEKIQWRKLYDNNPIYSKLSDKYAVREWVAEKIGGEYLIPLLGVWDSFDEIDFDALPEKFVLKTNNASGTNCIVTDKHAVDRRLLRMKFNFWMKLDFADFAGYEMHYKAIPPKIIAEKLIESSEGADLPDYKFICFDGKVDHIWVDHGRYHDHTRATFDTDWNPLPFLPNHYPLEENVPKPPHLNEMIAIAQKLSAGFDHVRVDLYDCEQIYFGEMTFTNASGFAVYHPDEYDQRIGSRWKIHPPIEDLINQSSL